MGRDERVDTAIDEELTLERAEHGMKKLREWYNAHPDKEGFVIIAGAEQDSWSPKTIMEKLEKRWEAGKLGEVEVHDIPYLVLLSASKAKSDEE